ncbi:MAG: protein-L-isoaspartate O-methyltransferase family protein [Pseudomonadota bacterium]
MARAPSLDRARRQFAEELRVTAHVGDERVVEAFATVPRERFAGPGPWHFLHLADGYWTTADGDPRWLYHNVLVALDTSRGINIGEPQLWAYHLDRIGVSKQDRVLQIGAGSGYYTAILAELAAGVDAIEIDEPLADAARRNLADRPTVRIHRADASHPIAGEWDVIVAFAGAAAPHRWWLDALADGGRLLLPMTADGRRGGFMLRLDRQGDVFAARSLGWVAFYPCIGARQTDDEAALREALGDAAGQAAVRSLRRDRHERDTSCWLHRDGWCLSRRALN